MGALPQAVAYQDRSFSRSLLLQCRFLTRKRSFGTWAFQKPRLMSGPHKGGQNHGSLWPLNAKSIGL